MTKDEALRLALEVLADLGMKHYENTGEVLYKNTYTAIKAALEAKDEPVAWMDASRFEELRNGFTVMTTLTKKKAFFDDVAIYTTPPQQEAKDEPVANNWSVFNTGAEVWDKLSLADAVVELTPSRLERGWSAVCVINKDNPPLYIAPPQRKPLTDEEMKAVVEQELVNYWDGEYIDTTGARDCLTKFARTIEAAHGIKGKTHDAAN